MALVKCPKCGRIVSTFADKCPHCGLPITDVIKVEAENIADTLPEEDADNTGADAFELDLASVHSIDDDSDITADTGTGDSNASYDSGREEERKQRNDNKTQDREQVIFDLPNDDEDGQDSSRSKKIIRYVIIALAVLTLVLIVIGVIQKQRELAAADEPVPTEEAIEPYETDAPAPEETPALSDSGKKISDAFFNRLCDYTVGNYVLKVPEEWEDEDPYVYPEKNDADYAMMYASRAAGEGHTEDDLARFADEMISELKDNHADSSLISKEKTVINGTEMIHARIDSKEPSVLGIIDVYWFLDQEDYSIISVLFFEGNGTEYDYSDVYSRIIHSIEFTGRPAPEPTPSASADASPSPSPSPSPSKTREPERTARPTTKPSASPTKSNAAPSSSPSPSPSGPAEPSDTPEPIPTDIPEPTPTDMPEPTQEPTPEPTPEKTQEPEKTKEPEPDTEP